MCCEFVSSKPYNTYPYSRQQSNGLPAVLSLSFAIWFWNIKQLKRERMNKLIMAGEISVVFTRRENRLWFLGDTSMEFIRKIRS
jgi:hypothetical protein